MNDNIKRLFRWRLLDEKEGKNRKGISDLELSRSRKELLFAVTGSEDGMPSSDNRFALIVTRWNEIAGPLARNCRPMEIRGRDLIVRVEKSVYSQEISLYSREILAEIKKVASLSIDRIRVEVGRFGAVPEAGSFKAKRPSGENRPSAAPAETVDATSRLLLDGLKKIKENQ